ncbi:MAG: transposase [Blastocatellia bacterium]|jgi:REP element-mobilizing transposase RayT|nr:transposase [Blastocatellia bacterium]MBK6428807.1 transposase [Blastocatellia bacterium]
MKLYDLPGPLAYFVSFRTYGTWLHGDARGSTDRRRNVYGEPWIPPNPRWQIYESSTLPRMPFTLATAHRRATCDAIVETCERRGWTLRAVNVRTNHVHVVVTSQAAIRAVLVALKAAATRRMRLRGGWTLGTSPWSRGGSTRYVWNAEQLQRVIKYVEDGQGIDLD